ncbi:hypothetical protein [Aminobacterium mobile]|jgi:hypothetical protein
MSYSKVSLIGSKTNDSARLNAMMLTLPLKLLPFRNFLDIVFILA